MSKPIRYFPTGVPPEDTDLFVVERANQNNYTFAYSVLKALFNIFPKAFGTGILIDPADPSFGWRDLEGPITSKETGGRKTYLQDLVW